MKKKRVKVQLAGLFKEELDHIERQAKEFGLSVNNWILDTLREGLLENIPAPKTNIADKGPVELSVYIDSIIADEFAHRFPRVNLPVWVKSLIRQKLTALRSV